MYQCTNSPSQKDWQNISVQRLIELRKSNLMNIGEYYDDLRHVKNEVDTTSKFEMNNQYEVSNITNRPVRYFSFPTVNPRLDFGEKKETSLKNHGFGIAISFKQNNLNINDNKMQVPTNILEVTIDDKTM